MHDAASFQLPLEVMGRFTYAKAGDGYCEWFLLFLSEGKELSRVTLGIFSKSQYGAWTELR